VAQSFHKKITQTSLQSATIHSNVPRLLSGFKNSRHFFARHLASDSGTSGRKNAMQFVLKPRGAAVKMIPSI